MLNRLVCTTQPTTNIKGGSKHYLLLFIYIFTILHMITVGECAPLKSDDSMETSMPSNEEEDENKISNEQMNELTIHEDFGFIRRQLDSYGYLRSNPTLHEFTEALKQFQHVLGVERTGKIDKETVAAASRPRCVQPDVRTKGKRSKRYSLSRQSKWDHFTNGNTLTLKWFISYYTPDLDKKTVRQIVKKAFDLWSNQVHIRDERKVNLNFVEAGSEDEAHINIKWAEGSHGDNYPFDGANGNVNSNMQKENVLAHTFFPGYEFPLNGDIHFDDAETWDVDAVAVNNGNGNRFFPYVLAHEIGHTLGLSHSRKEDALMYPYYKNVPLDQVQLDVDDKCGFNWNLAGPSNFCLFVWLMSEIVEDYNNGSPMTHSNNGVSPMSSFRTVKRLKKDFFRIPKCSSSNDRLKVNTEEKLKKQLHFTSSEAKKYSDVVCNFLAGLHMYRASSQYTPHEAIDKEYTGVRSEINSFTGNNKSSIRRMLRHAEHQQKKHQPSILGPSYFDDKFFDNFFSKYEN